MKEIIGFWKPADRNGFLSQWYKCSFKDSERYYNCAEQYMMAQKAILFKNYDVLSEIMKETNPANIKKLGRKIKNFDEATWDSKKFEIVCEGNRLKFFQNPTLGKQLLGTLDAILVEASPYDHIWGIGTENYMDENAWDGENLLGQALMVVREEMK